MGISRGLSHSQIDVVGLRDIGGDHSGAAEVLAIEVKRGNQPFATTSGQTAGYSVYANRVYLADLIEGDFSHDQKEIALHLGIGLISIGGGTSRLRITERLSAPARSPIPRMQVDLIAKLGFSRCSICETLFAMKDPKTGNSRVTKAGQRANYMHRAVASDKGLRYWHEEVSIRKKPYTDGRSNDYIYARRHVCPGCIATLFGHLVSDTD